jgi:hypothetical protein
MSLTKVTYSMIDGATINPTDYGADNTGATDSSAAFALAIAAASAANSALLLNGGTYLINSQVALTGDLTVVVNGEVTFNCAAGSPIDAIFKITGKLIWVGGNTIFDANDKAYLAIHCPTILPELENITFKNFLNVAGLFGRNFTPPTTWTGTNGVGHGYMKNCRGENVGSLCLPTGSGASSDTSFGLIDCQTDDQSGDAVNIFGLYDLGWGYVRGGYYKGVAGTAPNIYETGKAEYIGGRYEGMDRGPTTGKDTDYVTIVGGVSIDCVFSGVSIDARLTDNTVPYITGKVDWTVYGSPTHAVFVQASGAEINVRHVSDGTATGSKNTVRLTDSLDVALGTISCENAGAGVLVTLGSGSSPSPGSSAYKIGEWATDTTESPTAIRVNTDSTLTYKKTQSLSANGDADPFVDVILVNASAGAVDVDVPNATTVFADVIGKTWQIVVVDSTNNVTITRDGGGATAINGGSSYTIPSGTNYQSVFVTSIGGGNYVVSKSQ